MLLVRRTVRSGVMLESPQGVAVQSVCFERHSSPVFQEQTSTGHAAFDPCPAHPRNTDRAGAHRAGLIAAKSRSVRLGPSGVTIPAVIRSARSTPFRAHWMSGCREGAVMARTTGKVAV